MKPLGQETTNTFVMRVDVGGVKYVSIWCKNKPRLMRNIKTLGWLPTIASVAVIKKK